MRLRLSEKLEAEMAGWEEYPDLDAVRYIVSKALDEERAELSRRYIELCNQYGQYDVGMPSVEFIEDRFGLEAHRG